jgi:hypothetical protein
MLVLGPLVSLLITSSLPSSAYAVAVVALVCLAAAGTMQIAGAGYAALVSVRGNFVGSNFVYALAGLLGLSTSCVAIALLGAVGAALGVLVTGSFVLLGQIHLAGGRPTPWRRLPKVFDREQITIAREFVTAAAVPVAVQLHLVLLLAMVVHPSDDSITAITYSFLFVSLLLGASFQVVGGMGLAEVSQSSLPAPGVLRDFFSKGLPAAFRIAAPLAVLALILGPHVARAIPTAVLARPLTSEILDYLGPMTAVAIPWGFQAMLFSLALASGTTRRVVRTIPISFAVLALTLLAFGRGSSPEDVGIAMSLAETAYTLLMASVIFGTGWERVLVRGARAVLPALAVPGAALAVGYHAPLAVAGFAAAAAGLSLLWGVRKNRAFDAWAARLREQ